MEPSRPLLAIAFDEERHNNAEITKHQTARCADRVFSPYLYILNYFLIYLALIQV
jgi:hypothetical protein